MILWVMELEATESLTALSSKVVQQMPTRAKPRVCINALDKPSATGRQSIAYYHPGYNVAECKQPNEAMISTCKTLQDRIKAVPPFSQFMKGKRQRST